MKKREKEKKKEKGDKEREEKRREEMRKEEQATKVASKGCGVEKKRCQLFNGHGMT